MLLPLWLDLPQTAPGPAFPGPPGGPLYGRNIPTARPGSRKVDIRSLAFGAAGPEQWYPVYQFSGYRTRWEQPGHNPFKGL